MNCPNLKFYLTKHKTYAAFIFNKSFSQYIIVYTIQVNSLKINIKRDVQLVNAILPCQGCQYLKKEYSFKNIQIKEKSDIDIGELLAKGERSTVSHSFKLLTYSKNYLKRKKKPSHIH